MMHETIARTETQTQQQAESFACNTANLAKFDKFSCQRCEESALGKATKRNKVNKKTEKTRNSVSRRNIAEPCFVYTIAAGRAAGHSELSKENPAVAAAGR
jgi:hypothetical protein